MGAIRLISVEKVKRKKGWYTCSFDGADPLQVPDDIMVKNALSTGKALSIEQYDAIKSDAFKAMGKDHALTLLSFRERSERELKHRLHQKGLDRRTSDTVVKNLKDLKIVNDEAFAKRFAHDLVNRKPSGALLIKAELFKKGVSEKIITRVLDQLFSEIDPIDLAKRCADGWLKRHPRVVESEKKQKLAKFMQQRGFSWQQIEQVVGDSSAF